MPIPPLHLFTSPRAECRADRKFSLAFISALPSAARFSAMHSSRGCGEVAQTVRRGKEFGRPRDFKVREEICKVRKHAHKSLYLTFERAQAAGERSGTGNNGRDDKY